jgi:hypothetical protein
MLSFRSLLFIEEIGPVTVKSALIVDTPTRPFLLVPYKLNKLIHKCWFKLGA